MKFMIKHEAKGRMRIHAVQNRMSYAQADTLLYFLHSQKEVTFAKVYDRTCDAVISYVGDRQTIIELLRGFHYEDVEVPEGLIENSGRELNNTYQEKLIGKIVFHYARRWILPYPIRICLTSLRSVKYIWKGLTTLAAGKIEVPVLDATAIGVSVLRGDFNTAGSIMFMLGIGELLEENKNLRMEAGYFRRKNTPMRKKEINGIKHCPICNYPIDRHMPQHYCDGCGQALEIF